jgi:hypothetical protein
MLLIGGALIEAGENVAVKAAAFVAEVKSHSS